MCNFFRALMNDFTLLTGQVIDDGGVLVVAIKIIWQEHGSTGIHSCEGSFWIQGWLGFLRGGNVAALLLELFIKFFFRLELGQGNDLVGGVTGGFELYIAGRLWWGFVGGKFFLYAVLLVVGIGVADFD